MWDKGPRKRPFGSGNALALVDIHQKKRLRTKTMQRITRFARRSHYHEGGLKEVTGEPGRIECNTRTTESITGPRHLLAYI
jgi:hypothetical protein